MLETIVGFGRWPRIVIKLPLRHMRARGPWEAQEFETLRMGIMGTLERKIKELLHLNYGIYGTR